MNNDRTTSGGRLRALSVCALAIAILATAWCFGLFDLGKGEAATSIENNRGDVAEIMEYLNR